MTIAKGTNPNHPPQGQRTIVSPITDLGAIAAIRELLAYQPRNLCLFAVGINTGLRIGDLLALTVGQVQGLPPGAELSIRQQKRGKRNTIVINEGVRLAIRTWLSNHPNPIHNAPLFPGKAPNTAITVPYASRLVKSWCRAVGLRGNYAAHSLRKTFGYHGRVTHNQPIEVISAALGHNDIRTTHTYLGIQPQEVRKLFMCGL